MNAANFLRDPRRYFAGSYEEFVYFGGPCVYFHEQALRACAEAFLSDRHIEMIYATLTAWGMHRLGSGTKLVEWNTFAAALRDQKPCLETMRGLRMLELSPEAYSQAIARLKEAYCSLRVSTSAATVVAHSKTLCHILPELVPPIDRSYTLEFFKIWSHKLQGKSVGCQFDVFHDVCLRMKQLADSIDPDLFAAEREQHGVTPPKALDNAIVCYGRLHR